MNRDKEESKDHLRKEMTSRIKKGEFDSFNKELAPLLIHHILELLSSHDVRPHEKQLLGIYQPLKGEVDLTVLGEHSFQLAYPIVESKDPPLMNFFIRDEQRLCVPVALLVPGLVFTRQRGRLGRGGGYYDRYLEHFTGLKIGICWEEQLKNSLPMETHDVIMDFVVTEQRVY